MSKEREAFVEKYRKVYKVDKSLFVNDSGEFTDLFCQDAWVMWQATKAQAVPEGFVLVTVTPSDEFIDKLADVICNEFDTTISGSDHCAREAYKAMVSSCEP